MITIFLLFACAPLFSYCPFCDESVICKQQYYEGKLARAMLNYRPLITGATLIMPKRHVARMEDLTPEEFAEIGETAKKVQKAFEKVYGASDYLMVLQNGKNAGQTVYHVHFHMLPRKENSKITKIWLWWVMLTRAFDLWAPIDWTDLKKQRELLSVAICEC